MWWSLYNTSGFSATFALTSHIKYISSTNTLLKWILSKCAIRCEQANTEKSSKPASLLQTLLASWMRISRVMFAGFVIFASLVSPTSPESNLKQHSVMDGYAPVDFGRRREKWSPVNQIKDKYPWFAFWRKVLFWCLRVTLHCSRIALSLSPNRRTRGVAEWA